MRQFLYKLPSKIPRTSEELLRWHERYIAPFTLIAGFLFDAVIFRNIDLAKSNIVLALHLVVAAAGIVFFHLVQSGYLRSRLFLKLLPFAPSLIQFSFGALFSGFVILFSQSAAYATSWIFVAILAALLIGNERFRKLYTRFSFQATIYFAVLISFFVFFLPVLTLRVGTEMFLVSEAAAVLVMFVLIRAFNYYAPHIVREARPRLVRNIAAILLVFNVLYLTNAIPPIPLALKSAGVFHDVVRAGGVYRLEAEPLKWYQQYLNYNTVFRRAPGERTYVFSAIYAPPGLSTTIVHEWQHYDSETHEWKTRSSVSFPLSGGRDAGYRGYSFIENALPGAWRVNVRSGGKLVGRVSFTVEPVTEAIETITLER